MIDFLQTTDDRFSLWKSKLYEVDFLIYLWKTDVCFTFFYFTFCRYELFWIDEDILICFYPKIKVLLVWLLDLWLHFDLDARLFSFDVWCGLPHFFIISSNDLYGFIWFLVIYAEYICKYVSYGSTWCKSEQASPF